MADDDDGGKLPPVDHGPLNEGAMGKTSHHDHHNWIYVYYHNPT